VNGDGRLRNVFAKQKHKRPLGGGFPGAVQIFEALDLIIIFEYTLLLELSDSQIDRGLLQKAIHEEYEAEDVENDCPILCGLKRRVRAELGRIDVRLEEHYARSPIEPLP